MTYNIKLKLAKRIQELRNKKKLTRERFVELAGIDYKHIQLLESKNPPAAKIDTIEKLAKAFKISSSNIINFK